MHSGFDASPSPLDDDLHRTTTFPFEAGWPGVDLRTRLISHIGIPVALGVAAVSMGSDMLLVGVLVLLVIAIQSYRARRPKFVPSLIFEQTQMQLPVPGKKDAHVILPYDDLRIMGLQGQDPQLKLTLLTENQTFVYGVQQLGGVERLLELRREILARIARRPNGRELLQGLQDRGREYEEVHARPSPWTRNLTVLLGLGFVLEVWLGAAGSSLDGAGMLLRMGANAHDLVVDGQVERLLTANFLHGGWLHIYMNGMALLALGGVLERLIGSLRFLLLYLASGLAGAAASAFLGGASMSVGASTALFGLLGAWLLIQLRFHKQMPIGFSMSRARWAFILGLNAALPFVWRVIDTWAHAGGFLAGIILAFLFYPKAPRDLYAPPGKPIRLLAFAMILAQLLALGVSTRRFFEGDIAPAVLLKVLSDADTPNPHLQNNIAWRLVTDPKASPERLRQAGELAESAIQQAERREHRGAFQDTLATSYFRLGKFERAVRMELMALRLSANTAMLSQLARFLDAYGQDGQIFVEGLSNPEPASIERLGRALHLQLAGGQSLVALVYSETALIGLLRLSFKSPQHEVVIHLDDAQQLALGEDSRLQVALISAKAQIWDYPSPPAKLETETGDPVELQFTAIQAEVRDLP